MYTTISNYILKLQSRCMENPANCVHIQMLIDGSGQSVVSLELCACLHSLVGADVDSFKVSD